MKQENTKRVYRIGTLSTTDYSVAVTASANLTKAMLEEFRNEFCTLSQASKFLASSDSANAVFFKDAVLGLSGENAKSATLVFKAIQTKYPYKNNGNLCKVRTLCKGIFASVKIMYFDEDFLNPILSAYLQNRKQTELPDYFRKDEKTKAIVSISEDEALKSVEDAKAVKDAAKDAEKAKAIRYERVTNEMSDLLVEFSKAKTLKEFESVRTKFAEILK